MADQHACDTHCGRIILEKIGRESLKYASGPEARAEFLSDLEETLPTLENTLMQLELQFDMVQAAIVKNLDLSREAAVDGLDAPGVPFRAALSAAPAEIRDNSKASDNHPADKGSHLLDAAFSYGMSSEIWYRVQTSRKMSGLLAAQRTPYKNEAAKLRERGNKFFKSGLYARFAADRQKWMELALGTYQEAVEKNPADFSSLLGMGIIHFFELRAPEKAEEYFKKAAIAAEGYSGDHSAAAWLYVGYLYRCTKAFEKAREASAKALAIAPAQAEVNFQHAVNSGLISRFDDMQACLEKAITLDRYYWLRAAAEPDFWPLQKQIAEILHHLKAEAQKTARETLAKAADVLTAFSRLYQDIRNAGIPALEQSYHIWRNRETPEAKQERLKASEALLVKEGYFDYQDAREHAGEIMTQCKDDCRFILDISRDGLEREKRMLRYHFDKSEKEVYYDRKMAIEAENKQLEAEAARKRTELSHKIAVTAKKMQGAKSRAFWLGLWMAMVITVFYGCQKHDFIRYLFYEGIITFVLFTLAGWLISWVMIRSSISSEKRALEYQQKQLPVLTNRRLKAFMNTLERQIKEALDTLKEDFDRKSTLIKEQESLFQAVLKKLPAVLSEK